MKIKDLLLQSNSKIQKFSPSPTLDVEMLLSSILNKNREFLFSYPDCEISPEKIKNFNQLLNRRIQQEPIAYLTGEKNFYGRSFFVNSKTLIPRPETEFLIEKTLEHCHKEFYSSKDITLFDIGTGSGCILITLLKELQKKRFKDSNIKAIGTDICPQALKMAEKNRKKIIPQIKINFLETNLLNFVDKRYLKNTQMVITANLPYLSEKIYENCPKSVLDFEPKKALIAKNDGLGLYLELLKQIQAKELSNLVQDLYLILEISPEQKKLAKKLFKKIIPEARIKFSKDFTQKWRFIEIFF